MNRNPPSNVKKVLREEVGFGCPVPGCGRPYLGWHHFDPPWREENHHNPKGMIALCREHDIQADNGAFTKEQLRQFKRDENNYLLLNLRMLSTSKESRAYIQNNEWFNVGGEEDIECPPSAKRVKISYPNGDLVSIEFFEINDIEDAKKRYPDARASDWPIELPITAVEVTNIVANFGLEFNARETKFGRGNIMKNCFATHCGAGLSIS